jgi:hypothetical protein
LPSIGFRRTKSGRFKAQDLGETSCARTGASIGHARAVSISPHDMGFIKASFDVSEYADFSIVEDAAKRLK